MSMQRCLCRKTGHGAGPVAIDSAFGHPAGRQGFTELQVTAPSRLPTLAPRARTRAQYRMEPSLLEASGCQFRTPAPGRRNP